MTMTASQIKTIGQELSKLKPKKIKLDGNRTLTIREAIFTLAPTLLRLKKRNFELLEIVELLHEKGIEIKLGTLSRYLSEFQRGKDKKVDTTAKQKKDSRLENTAEKKTPLVKSEHKQSIHDQLQLKFASIHKNHPSDTEL